jgi:3alpha(or 20beta)-hydroxysteroid dehydrogenase
MQHMGDELAGRVALVSGGARGIGAAVARLLAAEGAAVLVGDLVPPDGHNGPEDADGTAFVELDVTSELQWARALEHARERFGPVTILVNNAGIMVRAPLVETSLADFEHVLRVNLVGQFLGIRAVVPQMCAAGGGSIVNVSSVAGLIGTSGRSAYSASKWGIRGLTKTAALELARDGIRVNSVHPGVTETDMIASAPGDVTASQPIPRRATPDEIAQMVLFLATDRSSYATGSEFIVDGGQLSGHVRPF